MQQDALFYWLALWRMEGLGPSRIATLLQYFGDAKSAFNAPLRQLATLIPEEIAQRFTPNTENHHRLLKGVETDLAWHNASNQHHIISWQNTEYPILLKNIASAPPILFIKGHLSVLQQLQIGIVGTRHPTMTGRSDAHAFAQQLAQQGWTITSGLAQGIDACAHEGALSAPGYTIAVLAHGLDSIYPSRHNELANKVCEQGALVSEFPIGTAPHPQLFPRRNRVISGLSRGVLVVEAAQRSGSLVTARYAIEQNREVFAIPGSIHNPVAKGCHELLRQGACLTESIADITQVLGLLTPTINAIAASTEVKTPSVELPTELSENELYLYKLLKSEMTSIDYLVENSALSPAAVSALLTLLEMKGYVQAISGGYCRAP